MVVPFVLVFTRLRVFSVVIVPHVDTFFKIHVVATHDIDGDHPAFTTICSVCMVTVRFVHQVLDPASIFLFRIKFAFANPVRDVPLLYHVLTNFFRLVGNNDVDGNTHSGNGTSAHANDTPLYTRSAHVQKSFHCHEAVLLNMESCDRFTM